MDPLDVAKQNDQAERMLREANLAKMRGDARKYSELLDQAKATAPNSVAIWHAVGDDYRDRRRLADAKTAYEKALAIEPENVTIDRKRAECILEMTAFSFESLAASDFESASSGRIAAILSFFVAGLGQIVTGQPVKGAWMMAGWLLGWFAAWLIPNGMSGLMGVFGLSRDAAAFSGVVLLPIALAVSCHLWSISDALVKAKSYAKKPVAKPIPPVDKDFEL